MVELALELVRIAARIDHDSVRSSVGRPHDVAIRGDRSELVAFDGKAHDGRVYGVRRQALVRILLSCGAGTFTRSRSKAAAAHPSFSTPTRRPAQSSSRSSPVSHSATIRSRSMP